jgi:hypothetical protein
LEKWRSNAVSGALLLLVSLIAVTPEILVIDNTIIDGFSLAIVAIGIAIVSLSMRTGEAGRIFELLRPVTVAALIPTVWMLIQIVPLSTFGLAHPVWTSAAAALEQPIAGSISIDLGATLLSLSRYLCFSGIVILSTSVTLERRRAALILPLLTAVTALIAAELMSYDLGWGRSFLSEFGDAVKHAEALDSSVLGLVLSASSALRALEWYEMRRTNRTSIKLALALLTCAVAFAICLGAVVLNWDRILFFGAAYGLGTLTSVAAIRRLGVGKWGKYGLISLSILGAIGLITTAPGIDGADPTLALSRESDSFAVAQRMLSDVAWTGTGAGTFETLVPIYRIAEAGPSTAPTAAASVAIELGRPMLLVLMTIIFIGILMLVNGALRRGRDFVYPAAGASGLMALLILAFGNVGVLGPAISCLAGATLGLALSQSRSWTNWAHSKSA